LAILGAFADTATDERAGQALALLALIAGQDVEPADDGDGTDGRWRIARRVASDRVISTVDTDARHVHKTVHQRQDGYKGHVAVEPETGIFTAVQLAKAILPMFRHAAPMAMPTGAAFAIRGDYSFVVRR
jgi:hypothetical protein